MPGRDYNPRMSSGRGAGVLSRDTPRDVEALQVCAWRALSALDLARLVAGTSRAVRSLALAGIRRRHPEAGEEELVAHLAAIMLGPALAREVSGDAVPSFRSTAVVNDPIDAALLVTAVLEACGVRYTVGGSIASSVSGEPRASIDADIVVDMQPAQVGAFVQGIGTEFYVDADALRRAIGTRSSTNLVHRRSGIKVDLFVAGSELDARQLERRQLIQVASDPDRFLYVHSPEDILIQKLHWYRAGNEGSDRQWRDVLAILLVQGTRLDREYVTMMAARVGLTDLLERAYREAGPVR